MSHEVRSGGTKFGIGDVVKLRSGGPDMTVTGCELGGVYQCTWFTFGDESRSSSFSEEALILVKSMASRR
jgi:uncharacterized protein YodC (DUF2158 family)